MKLTRIKSNTSWIVESVNNYKKHSINESEKPNMEPVDLKIDVVDPESAEEFAKKRDEIIDKDLDKIKKVSKEVEKENQPDSHRSIKFIMIEKYLTKSFKDKFIKEENEFNINVVNRQELKKLIEELTKNKIKHTIKRNKLEGYKYLVNLKEGKVLKEDMNNNYYVKWLDNNTIVAYSKEKFENDEGNLFELWVEKWIDDNNSIHMGINYFENDNGLQGDYLDTEIVEENEISSKYSKFKDLFATLIDVVKKENENNSNELEEEKQKLNIVKGKSLEDYMKIYGDDYKEGSLWDFDKEDLENGAIEPEDDMIYWEIDGRYYEAPKLNENSQSKQFDRYESEDFGKTFKFVDTITTSNINDFMNNEAEKLDYDEETDTNLDDWLYDEEELKIYNSFGNVIKFIPHESKSNLKEDISLDKEDHDKLVNEIKDNGIQGFLSMYIDDSTAKDVLDIMCHLLLDNMSDEEYEKLILDVCDEIEIHEDFEESKQLKEEKEFDVDGFTIKPLDKNSKEDAKRAVQLRKDAMDWYVIDYEEKDGDYLYGYDFDFKTLEDAMKEFESIEPSTSTSRVELMFAPAEDDKEFSNNIVVKYKKRNLKESKEELSDDEIITILGIEKDAENPYMKDFKSIAKQFRTLASKHEKDNIWLKSDKPYYDKGKVVKSTKDLVVVEGCSKKTLKESISFSEFEECCGGDIEEMIKTLNDLRSGESYVGLDLIKSNLGLDDLNKREYREALDELEELIISALDDSGDYTPEESKKYSSLIESNKSKQNEKSLNEDVKIIADLSDYRPWSGAVDLWREIEDNNLVNDLDFILEDIYPDGLTMTELNDLLWFESDWVREQLGLIESNEDDDVDESFKIKEDYEFLYDEETIKKAKELHKMSSKDGYNTTLDDWMEIIDSKYSVEDDNEDIYRDFKNNNSLSR